MVQLTKMHHAGFTVRSIDRSLEFYCGLLGLELVFRWNPQAPYIRELVGYPTVSLHGAILRVPGAEGFLELLEYQEIPVKTVDMANGNIGNGHVAFNVDDLDTMYEKLVRAGVKSVSPPVTPTIGPNKGGRAVYLIDPDGFRVELIQSAVSFGDYKPD